MDHDGSRGWHALGYDLQLSITSLVDKRSLQAVMQTSRDLRLLASSLISSIEVRDASALAHYPRHAAAINSIHLWMRPSPGDGFMEPPEEAHMEPRCAVSWLQATTAACTRLAAVTIVQVELTQMPHAMDPATMDNLLACIGQGCPNLRCLHIFGTGIDLIDEDVIRAIFSAMGQHLPGIIELELDWGDGDSRVDLNIAGIDWAACLPRGLQQFTCPVSLHHELLQQLVLMPSLTEVSVFKLSNSAAEDDEGLEVQSESCAWRILTLESLYFPSCQVLGRFTAAMPLLDLYLDDDASAEWTVGGADGPVLAKAAAWLSQIYDCPAEIALVLIPAAAAAASTAGLVSSLAPLSSLASLELSEWPVTEQTLDELALALPNVHTITLCACTISSGAWLRLPSLTSVTRLRIIGGTTSLAQIITLASAISRPMTLILGSTLSMEDKAGWEAFEELIRRSNGLWHLTVNFI